jgi:hypothetical protein
MPCEEHLFPTVLGAAKAKCRGLRRNPEPLTGPGPVEMMEKWKQTVFKKKGSWR